MICEKLRIDGVVDLSHLYPEGMDVTFQKILQYVKKQKPFFVNTGRNSLWFPYSKLTQSEIAKLLPSQLMQELRMYFECDAVKTFGVQVLMVSASSKPQAWHRDFHTDVQKHVIVGISMSPQRKLQTQYVVGSHRTDVEVASLTTVELQSLKNTFHPCSMVVFDAHVIHRGSVHAEQFDDYQRIFLHVVPTNLNRRDTREVVTNQAIPRRLLSTKQRRYCKHDMD